MNIKALFLGLAFALMWSSAFTSARVIVAHASPLASLSARFFLSGLLGLALAYAMGQSLRLNRAQWRATIIFGICQNALYLGLNFVAMQWVEASLASIIASTMPLMVAFAGWVLFKDRLSAMGVFGLVLGVVGVAVIMGARLEAGLDPLGLALCVLGAAALTVATLAVRGAASGGNVMSVVGLQMLVGGAILAVASAATETIHVTWSWQLVTWMVSVAGQIGAVKASTFHFLNPFFGVAIAAMILDEALGLLDVAGVVVIAVGILMVQLAKQRPAAG